MRATLRGFVVVVLGLAVVAPVQAQLGGLMRRAKEAAEKKTAEKDPRAPEPSSSTQNPFADPAVVFITQDQLGRFEKGLQYEIAQRNELRKSLATARTREDYQACTQSVATSPEMMKMIQDMADSSANGTPEQLMKAQQKMYADMQSILTKTCGPDPQQAQSGRSERLRQIEAEASDVAMPPGYTPPAGMETGSASGKPRVFARPYGMLKERIPVFCATDKKASAPTPITVGNEKMTIVRVQGQGMQYAFRQDEVDTLNKGCGTVMALMNQLFDSDAR